LVLAAYSGTHVSPGELYRPVVVFLLVAIAAFGLIGGATRRWHAASFAISLSLLMVIGDAVLWCLLIAGWLILIWRSLRRREGWDVTPRLTRPLNVLVTAWFGLASVTAVAVSLPPSDLPTVESAAIKSSANVYLVLLDGYPRADSLMDSFGFANSPFLDALEDRGFLVAQHSTAPYVSTVQTVPTMMQMRLIPELLGEEWNGSDAQQRRLWHLLNTAPGPAAYKAAGYTTYSIVSPAPAVDWRTADVVLQSPWLSVFEEHLVGYGVLRPVLPLQAMHRATILDAFYELEASAGTSPRFVFAHIFSPHAPYVFTADGGPAQACGPECKNHAGPPNPLLAERLIGQLRFLNGRVIEAVDRIIEADPKGIIILFSDHGLRRDRTEMDEWFRTLYAARGVTVRDDMSTLQIFPALLR
jgi:hypothetical protein